MPPLVPTRSFEVNGNMLYSVTFESKPFGLTVNHDVNDQVIAENSQIVAINEENCRYYKFEKIKNMCRNAPLPSTITFAPPGTSHIPMPALRSSISADPTPVVDKYLKAMEKRNKPQTASELLQLRKEKNSKHSSNPSTSSRGRQSTPDITKSSTRATPNNSESPPGTPREKNTTETKGRSEPKKKSKKDGKHEKKSTATLAKLRANLSRKKTDDGSG